ncbi:MAG: STAS domain-containing protein [Nocardioides sp.]|nr:STAS domain-containing protein [Nocardioides sp.]
MDITSDGPTLILVGDFDVRSTGQVRHAIYDHLGGLDHDVVIDLTGVATIDVTALRVLAVATREAGKAGHHLTLRGCGPSVRRMLHLSRLRRAVEVEADAASA